MASPAQEPKEPGTVDEIFKDYMARRAGILKALTEDTEELYEKCKPEEEYLCLFGLPNEEWEVSTVTEKNFPPLFPQPAEGINVAINDKTKETWLTEVATLSDAWLVGVAFFYGAKPSFGAKERMSLFGMINQLPTVFEVVDRQLLEKAEKEKRSADQPEANSKVDA